MQSLAQILPIPAVEYALAAAYIVIAASVTADVLLKKSDIRAAMGWIAADWLSPLLGGRALLPVRHQPGDAAGAEAGAAAGPRGQASGP